MIKSHLQLQCFLFLLLFIWNIITLKPLLLPTPFRIQVIFFLWKKLPPFESLVRNWIRSNNKAVLEKQGKKNNDAHGWHYVSIVRAKKFNVDVHATSPNSTENQYFLFLTDLGERHLGCGHSNVFEQRCGRLVVWTNTTDHLY